MPDGGWTADLPDPRDWAIVQPHVYSNDDVGEEIRGGGFVIWDDDGEKHVVNGLSYEEYYEWWEWLESIYDYYDFEIEDETVYGPRS